MTIQVFNDMQCSSCREDFLSTIPALAEDYARARRRQAPLPPLLEQRKPEELGFYGAEAAAEQGYGWQYTYLFFRNQDEAERFGVDQDFLDSVAGGVEELNGHEWEADLEANGGPGGAISRQLQATRSWARASASASGQAAIVSGPNGTETLQDGPTLAEIERAIGEVS